MSSLPWTEFYPDLKVDLKKIKYHSSYKNLFDKLFSNEKMKNIETKLTEELNNGNTNMFPYPELLFNTFNITPLNKIKVVILGQDPYFCFDTTTNKKIPQATGLSFSVPKGVKIPSSLVNIYKNQLKFKHIKKYPTTGNLEFWACQGVLMLNTSLTVLEGDSNKNCHQNVWKWFSDEIIKYIADNTKSVVFVLWGSNAIDKAVLIDPLDKNDHQIIMSSHPSGLSASSGCRGHLPFNDVDHFKKINDYLKEHNKTEIIWNLF